MLPALPLSLWWYLFLRRSLSAARFTMSGESYRISSHLLKALSSLLWATPRGQQHCNLIHCAYTVWLWAGPFDEQTYCTRINWSVQGRCCETRSVIWNPSRDSEPNQSFRRHYQTDNDNRSKIYCCRSPGDSWTTNINDFHAISVAKSDVGNRSKIEIVVF